MQTFRTNKILRALFVSTALMLSSAVAFAADYSIKLAYENNPGEPFDLAMREWARLFAESEGFLETRLLRAKESPGVYQTIDRWTSREAYAEFKRDFAARYDELDEEVGDLSRRETYIGLFDEIEV